MNQITLDWKKYEKVARMAAAEGNVLLKNENEALPLKQGTKLAVFGRIQLHYYKSGTGSGGMVNVDKVTGILEALEECEEVTVIPELLDVYKEWDEAHPEIENVGWGRENWSMEEMPVSEELAKKFTNETDTALIIIGRTAGEDRDNLDKKGAYRLTDIEEDMIHNVRKYFQKVIVVLNVGNIMDMSFVEKENPDAVLYAWQGGMTGGLGTVDVLTGKVTPSGKLTDTIAYEMEDYPSAKNFGNRERNLYEEDIYVGYRYFESVAKDKVMYPFGFGLSYTTFNVDAHVVTYKNDTIKIAVTVENTGNCPGKEVVQVYVNPPQGKLGKPLRNLAAFQKTDLLYPGDEEEFVIEIPFQTFASYDDSGVTGHKSAYVLEEGTYEFYVGNNVRDAKNAGEFILDETKTLEQLTQALAPKTPFERMKVSKVQENQYWMALEPVPLRNKSPKTKRLEVIPTEIPITGDQGYQLNDVKQGKVSMSDFIAQFEKEDLACIIRGEGMGSPKVTPGTAAAFGGVSDNLKNHGIPCGCCSDGPSGMRLDCGTKAFSLPIGTLLACSFNTELLEELFTLTGYEMRNNHVDVLLGPGMNIHRHPLNGRNFEYFSEDPLVTGKMASAELKGLKKAGVTGAIKHFCGNNQETYRHFVDSVISERALREIYLKGFEIAVKEANADAIMTTYGAVNGIWTAGSYDLCTTILRNEWGFKGFVMTDWWAIINDEDEEPCKANFAAMARAQNDVYMVCPDASYASSGDNTLEALEKNELTIAELQRNAGNVLEFLMNTQAFNRLVKENTEVTIVNRPKGDSFSYEDVVYHVLDRGTTTINLEDADTSKGSNFVFAVDVPERGGYKVTVTGKSDLGELAQIPVSLFSQSITVGVFTFNGTGGKWVSMDRKICFTGRYAVMRLYFGQSGVSLKDISFTFIEDLDITTQDKINKIMNEKHYMLG